MIISACIKRPTPIRLRRVRGQDYDWGPAASLLAFTFAYAPRRFKPPNAGHTQIPQDQSEIFLLPRINSLLAPHHPHDAF